MTERQLCVFSFLYLALLAVVAVVTRANRRRIMGAVAGGAAAGVAALGIVVVGERAGWWRFVMRWDPYFLALFWLAMIPCGFIFLITWRIARRFGARGLVVCVCAVAVIGPFRDSWFMARFPEWGSYGPGIAPMLATSAAYVLLGIVGHVVMRLVAGPAGSDRFRSGVGF